MCVCVCVFVCVCVCFQRHNQYRCKNVHRNTDIVRHCLVEHLETGIGQVASFGGIAREPQYFFSKKLQKKLSRGCFVSQ